MATWDSAGNRVRKPAGYVSVAYSGDGGNKMDRRARELRWQNINTLADAYGVELYQGRTGANVDLLGPEWVGYFYTALLTARHDWVYDGYGGISPAYPAALARFDPAVVRGALALGGIEALYALVREVLPDVPDVAD